MRIIDFLISKKIISFDDQKRILITENIKADYIINNYRDWNGIYKKKKYEIPKNFIIYKEIKAYNLRILSIFKKI